MGSPVLRRHAHAQLHTQQYSMVYVVQAAHAPCRLRLHFLRDLRNVDTTKCDLR